MRGRLSFPRWWFPWLVPTLKISLSPAEQQRTERVVAVARFFFSGVSLLAVWIDPTLLTSDPVVAYTLFGGYLAAATVMCVRLRGTYIPTRRVQVAWHAGDLVWMAMLTQMTEGPNSPFPLVYFFVLLSAAYRWGFLETVGTAIFVVGVVVFQFLLQSDGLAGETTWFDMKGPLVGTSYVSIAGGLLGYLAEEERYRRIETVIVGRLMPKIRPDTSMRATLETAAAEILPLLSAHTLLVSWTDAQSGRTFVWTVVLGPAGALRTDLSEIPPGDADRSRLEVPGAVWHIDRSAPADRGSVSRILALDADGRRIKPASLRLPLEWITRYPVRSLTGITVTFAEIGSGVILLFDARSGSAPALRLVQRLTNHLVPAVYSVYQLRRLRSRVSALERARIARELHDGLIQSLIGLQMQVDALRRSPRDSAAVVNGLGRIQELLAKEVRDVRDIMHQLEPVDFTPRELVPHLHELVDRFERETGICARFVSDVEEVTLSATACHELARITREALVNARKHGGARNVLVRFTATSSEYSLTIHNDGRPFEFEGRLSHADLDRTRKGPAVIKARVRAIGGELSIDSVRDEGVVLEVTVPRAAFVHQRTA